MTCAFFSLLMLIGGVISLSYLGWRRVSSHLRANPEAAKLLVDHIVGPLLIGNKPQTEEDPESK
jgi:hypothetical protein